MYKELKRRELGITQNTNAYKSISTGFEIGRANDIILFFQYKIDSKLTIIPFHFSYTPKRSIDRQHPHRQKTKPAGRHQPMGAGDR